jgi:hypothetical protein
MLSFVVDVVVDGWKTQTSETNNTSHEGCIFMSRTGFLPYRVKPAWRNGSESTFYVKGQWGQSELGGQVAPHA